MRRENYLKFWEWGEGYLPVSAIAAGENICRVGGLVKARRLRLVMAAATVKYAQGEAFAAGVGVCL